SAAGGSAAVRYERVWGVALSADTANGQRQHATVSQWDTRGGLLVATSREHTSGIWAVALSAEGQLLASASWDGTNRLFEAPSGRALATLNGHVGSLHGVELTPDGRLLVSGSGDGTVRQWDVATGQLVTTIRGH